MSELKRVRGGRVLAETVSEVVTVSLFLSLPLPRSLALSLPPSLPPFLQAAHGYILLVPKMLYTPISWPFSCVKHDWLKPWDGMG